MHICDWKKKPGLNQKTQVFWFFLKKKPGFFSTLCRIKGDIDISSIGYLICYIKIPVLFIAGNVSF